MNFFDGYADGFDEIYDDDYTKKGIVKFLIDKYLRKSIYARFDYTMKSLKDPDFKNVPLSATFDVILTSLSPPMTILPLKFDPS